MVNSIMYDCFLPFHFSICFVLISTMLGLHMLGYLYLRYISNDAESVLVLAVIWRIGAALVCGMGIIAIFLKCLVNNFFSER